MLCNKDLHDKNYGAKRLMQEFETKGWNNVTLNDSLKI